MWNPPIALTLEEQKIAARTRQTRKFFVLLRESTAMSASTRTFSTRWPRAIARSPQGRAPGDVGLLALASLLQAYCHVGDRDAVARTVMDKRWQMVLDCVGAAQPPCSQGTPGQLSYAAHGAQPRQDLAGSDCRRGGTDRRRRGHAAARRPGLPPLFGAGRVENPVHVLGHAWRREKALRLVLEEAERWKRGREQPQSLPKPEAPLQPRNLSSLKLLEWRECQRAELVACEVRPRFCGKKRACAPQKRGGVRVQAPPHRLGRKHREGPPPSRGTQQPAKTRGPSHRA